jgi:lipopolysaccharide transport system permease protein
MLADAKELWRYRELLFVMVQRELRIRYKNSFLGIIWSFLNPLLQVAVMSFVFNTFMQDKVNNYTAYMLSAYLPFLFFQSCVLDSSQSILVQLPLIKKIYFPREILPLAAVLANLIHLVFGFIIFFAFLLLVYIGDNRINPFQITSLYLPVLMLISFCLATGFSFIISALNTFYEDVKYIAQVGLYLLFYLCPIIYFSENVANSEMNTKSGFLLYKLYNLNPIAVLSQGYRRILLAETPVMVKGQQATALPFPWKYLAYTSVLSIAILVFGYWLFNRLKWKFVERP